MNAPSIAGTDPHPSRADLELYVIDAAPPERALALESHLVRCARCAAALTAEARLEEVLYEVAEHRARSSAPIPIRSARSFSASPSLSLSKSAAALQPQHDLARWRRPLYSGFAAAAALFAILVFSSRHPASPSGDPYQPNGISAVGDLAGQELGLDGGSAG